ncbi:MAG: hypothetical protein EBY39_11145 [Flavobacteriia bacterium]|nr:hypothetical protein [Flavobacteriia bacterium]
MTRVELPKWFNGQKYDEGDTVTNPFSGQSYELTAEELSMYDFIIGATQLMEIGMYAPKTVNDMRRGLDWFRKNNPEAYYVLLD